MSTPQATDVVPGRQSADAVHTKQPPQAAAPAHSFDKSAYAEKARSWNEQPLQPWSIATLVHTDKMHAVLARKELQFDLLDWFEDARVGAVMRGEKIVSESEFWAQLYRQSVGAIQQHFGALPIRVVDSLPQGKHTLVFGEKPSKQSPVPSMPSPVAIKPPFKGKKRPYKPRA